MNNNIYFIPIIIKHGTFWSTGIYTSNSTNLSLFIIHKGSYIIITLSVRVFGINLRKGVSFIVVFVLVLCFFIIVLEFSSYYTCCLFSFDLLHYAITAADMSIIFLSNFNNIGMYVSPIQLVRFVRFRHRLLIITRKKNCTHYTR